MILRTLTVHDFQQFRGTHRIEFAVPDTTSRKNVTVILGSSGSGKSNLVRALRFCLFGEQHLTQDAGRPAETCPLVSIQAIRASEGEPAKATVEVAFSHGGQECILGRNIIAQERAGTIVEKPGQVRLVVRNEESQAEIVTDQQEVARRIGEMLGDAGSLFWCGGERAAGCLVPQPQAVNQKVAEMLAPVASRYLIDGRMPLPGNKWINILSLGEQQVMDMACAVASLDAAVDRSRAEAPFITDDPLGCLNAELREHVLRTVPEFCSQWVILTGYLGEAEIKVLQGGSRWGRFYELRGLADGSTIVEERNARRWGSNEHR